MKKISVALTSVLLGAFAQSVLAQSAIETALQATVTIEVTGPDGLSHGSGFIVSSDGMIITAAHVIDGATTAVVRLQNGEELNVEGVIAIDVARDFAIVRVAGFDLPTVPLGNADDLSVGQRIIVIGAPMNAALAGTLSDGLLAGDRIIAGTRTLQISAPTSPGSSGGPVLTDEGQVIGLVVSGITGAGAENLNFALPINYVRGQLSLAATRPLQALAEVGITASGGNAAQDPISGVAAIPADENVSVRAVVTKTGLYELATLPGDDGGLSVTGKLAVVSMSAGDLLVGWWQPFEDTTGGVREIVNAYIEIDRNGAFSIPLHTPLQGGFIRDGLVVLAPQGTELALPARYPSVKMERVTLSPLEVGGIYNVSGTGGMTEVGANQRWNGEVIVIPTTGGVGQPQNEAVVVAALHGDNGEDYVFMTYATIGADGYFDWTPLDMDGERWSGRGRVTGVSIQFYVHRNRSFAPDYEASVSGRRR